MIVTMHFGDGSFKEIEVDSADPEDALEEARSWVSDNAWFEITNAQGERLADDLTLT